MSILTDVEKALQLWGESYRMRETGSHGASNITAIGALMANRKLLKADQHESAVHKLLERIKDLRAEKKAAPSFPDKAPRATYLVVVQGLQPNKAGAIMQVPTTSVRKWCRTLLKQHDINMGYHDDGLKWQPTNKQTRTTKTPVFHHQAHKIDQVIQQMLQDFGSEGRTMQEALWYKYVMQYTDADSAAEIFMSKALYTYTIKMAKIYIAAKFNGITGTYHTQGLNLANQ